MLYVTQRPGSSRLAISVNTLTTGSHATVIFRSPGFRSPDLVTSGTEGALRASRATGIRTTTDVSERPYNRTETARVCIAPSGKRPARSALAARLITASDGPEELGTAPERSRPAANWTAPPTPHISETAIAAKIPLDSCDMMRRPSPHGDQGTQRERNGGVRSTGYHLTVFKNICRGRERLSGLSVIPAAGYPPCPIDRRCGARLW
jgi:hypothetical protein